MSHAPVTTLHDTHCCGVLELDSLQRSKTPEAAFKQIAAKLICGPEEYKANEGHHARFVIITGQVGFTDGVTGVVKSITWDYAGAFLQFIKDHGLGNVTESSRRKNWTGWDIKVWIWEPEIVNVVGLCGKLGLNKMGHPVGVAYPLEGCLCFLCHHMRSVSAYTLSHPGYVCMCSHCLELRAGS